MRRDFSEKLIREESKFLRGDYGDEGIKACFTVYFISYYKVSKINENLLIL